MYAAGLINAEHPGAYAAASEKAKLIGKLAGGISNVLSDNASRLQKLIDTLDGIEESESLTNPERFMHPDAVAASRAGSPRDKALLAFGLYSRLFGDSKNAYVAVGDESSYLIFQRDEEWQYLDCKSNLLRSFAPDDVYLVFNKDTVYNKQLEIGEKPEFLY